MFSFQWRWWWRPVNHSSIGHHHHHHKLPSVVIDTVQYWCWWWWWLISISLKCSSITSWSSSLLSSFAIMSKLLSSTSLANTLCSLCSNLFSISSFLSINDNLHDDNNRYKSIEQFPKLQMTIHTNNVHSNSRKHHYHHHHHRNKSSQFISKLFCFTAFCLISICFQFSQVSSERLENGFKSTNTSTSTATTNSHQLSTSLGSLFDPRVNAKCERNLMHITVNYDQPFNGIIHVRNYRRNPCQTYGNGSLVTTLTIDLLAQTNKPNYCGVVRVKGSEERSISLVIRLHRALELSDDKYFVITCGNTEFFNRNKNEKLMFKFVDTHGQRINKLYHGEAYRLRAEIISSQDGSSSSLAGSINSYHLYVKNCFIFNGNDSDIEFLDGSGCPTLATVKPFRQIGHNIAEAEIESMFKLPGTNQLHLQCMVELVDNCPFCEASLCSSSSHNSSKGDVLSTKDSRKSKELKSVDMQMLASTTAYVLEPDQQLAAPIINNSCSEWRFPWLIALCIMLGVMLIIMMVVNIFLCTSMSCSCFKPEIVEHEPTIIEDYDPYKIDVGFYSPYDSRLSLNRNYTTTAASYSDSDHYQQHIAAHHHQQQQQQHPHHSQQPILLSSYSPDESHRPRSSRNAATVAAKNRSTAHQTHPYNPYERHTPPSVRSQEFY